MNATAKDTRATIIAVMRYRDADAALKFLTDIFGFAEHTVYRGEDGEVQHAELSFGNGMIMIGPVDGTAFGRLMREPREAGGVTGALYVIVADPDAHHAKSVEAGFDIVMELRDVFYGEREYSVRDPEGNIWTFGTYDPWVAQEPGDAPPA
ncbi:VOC family protein [Devosia nitrariae]|uniref:VOC domain-containing protein n=1 Tax=Devosia nitrariae TaxID=2071872 RepID=A0ABQ5W253_9HYPH|nr:VOC family protein [Devosia nitrariae]GLQ54088.1 hypothetical protein GCM10010862_13470 [Devosia nitrariae]